MSYPHLSGYGSYYDSSQSQPAHNANGSRRQSEGASYNQSYSCDDRRVQYPTLSEYNWTAQGQYGYSPHPPQSYDPWREANGQGTRYDYSRETSGIAMKVTAGNTEKSYGGSGSTPKTSSMAGLHHLAYMSGLDDQRSVTRTPHTSSEYSPAAPSREPNSGQFSTQHPHGASQRQQHSYPGQNAPANTTSQKTPSTTSGTVETPVQSLVFSAAQALAGAVNRKTQLNGAPQESPSSAMRSTNPPRGSHLPYSADRAPSAQSQRNTTNSSTNAISNPEAANTPWGSQSGTQHGRNVSQSKRSATSQLNSISNLVGSTQEAAALSPTTEVMPTYIDPTQVFNPYHREHERRRKEAAEVEARKNAEEAATAKIAAEAHTQVQNQNVPQSSESMPSAKASPTAVIAPSEAEDEITAEMRIMMEKMKVFRQKDPGMFQKLWDDMRKPCTSNAPATDSQAPSPQLNQRQTISTLTTLLAAPAAPTSGSPLSHVPGSQGTKARDPRPKPHAASAFPHVQANGYKVVVENNEEGLPDMGRFPAERRIRPSYAVRNTSSAARQMLAVSPDAFHNAGSANNKSQATFPGQVPGPLPAKTVSGGVEWPKDKRDALAKAAIQALKSIPENSLNEITAGDIHAILDLNPSYIELCDLLTKRGLRFHRGHFARQLLNSVPDLTTPQKAKEPQAQPKGATPASAPPTTTGLPSMVSTAPKEYSLPHQGPTAFRPGQTGRPSYGYQSGALYGPGPPSHFQGMGTFTHFKPEFPKTVNKAKKNIQLLVKPEPAPGSKEAMARKRDFSELIDLTQLDDNDDYVQFNKHSRLDSPSPEPDPFERYRLQASEQPSVVSSSMQFPSKSIDLAQGRPLRFDSVQRPSVSQQTPPSPAPPKMTILAKAVNKGEALRKSYYNPKTVARDILIAAGRHPQERPLNAHMASLLGKHIELDSDLSTFDWDAIDPGGPPMPRVGYVDIPATPPRFPLGQRTDHKAWKARDQLKDRVEQPRLPDSAKPDPVGGASARAPPGPQFSKERFATRYYSGRGRPPRGAVRGHQPSRLRENQVVDLAGLSTPALSTPQHPSLTFDCPDSSREGQSVRSSSRQLRETMEVATSADIFYPSGKRRGRPPGSKNKQMSVAAMKKFATTRPQVEIEVPSSLKGKAIFKCRWRRCKTELHNLDTLRKHIARVHRPRQEEIEEGGCVCWWKECQYLQADDEGNIEPTQAFATLEDWMEHINDDHVHRVAMKYGDGPNTSQIDSQTVALDKARYLADDEGRSTTPAVSKKGNHELPQDAMTFSHPVGDEGELKAQKAFMKAHRPGEKICSKNEAEETLRAMEARKAKIGPGIDRGGCTLVNDARRATLVQNPGIRRVVDADY